MLVVHRLHWRVVGWELTAWWAESEREARRCRRCGLAFVASVGCYRSCRLYAEGVRTWLREVVLVPGVVWKGRRRARSHEAWITLCMCLSGRRGQAGGARQSRGMRCTRKTGRCWRYEWSRWCCCILLFPLIIVRVTVWRVRGVVLFGMQMDAID
jgi:hypothetical protein